jgi:hypothetical protein
MFAPTIPLKRTGPFKQIQSEGFFGKSYAIPDKNPENASYMPECASGPCAQYSYSYGPKGERQETCVRYLEPTRVPEKTNFFNAEPEKNRTSCGYNSNPVGLFSSNEPTYYVYHKEMPIGGKNKSIKGRKDIKNRKGSKTIKNMRGGNGKKSRQSQSRK